MNFHDHIDSIDATKENWTLKVRVTRMWPSINAEGQIVLHNMIILDSRDTHIHVVVNADLWNQINPPVFEGGLYLISRFRVLDSGGLLRPVRNINYISFIQSTTMNQIFHDDLAIPLHKFEITPLSNLEVHASFHDEGSNQVYATDVVGVLHALEPIKTIMTPVGKKEVIRFSLFDGSTSCPVRFFGSPNENVQSIYDHGLQNHVILILAYVKISKHQGEIHITNLPGSKVYINLEYPDVWVMRERLP